MLMIAESSPMYSLLLRRARAMLAAAFVLLAWWPSAQAGIKAYTVTAPDGVSLAVQESGNPAGPPVIFVHGLLGSHLSWQRQLASPALQRYRLITYDLRGHGLSGKPAGLEAYRDGRRWADDLAAVSAASGARRPVLVGWSLGAAVISNYLAAHGDAGIASPLYVGGVVELRTERSRAPREVYRGVASPDLRTRLDGQRRFLRLCFHAHPDTPTCGRLLANAARAAWDMQRGVPSRSVAARQG